MIKQKIASTKSDSMNAKIIPVLIIAGLGCLGFGLLAAPSINRSVVSDSKRAAVVDQSGTNMSLVTAIPFHLERNQELTMKLVVYLNETAVSDDQFRLKVISSKTYNDSLNRDPSLVVGINYGYDDLTYPPTTITYVYTSANFSWVTGTEYVLTFEGDTPTQSKPLPGDYYIIIYSDDATPDGTTLYYDLLVQLDGFAPTLILVFCIIGGVLLGLGVVLALRKRRG